MMLYIFIDNLPSQTVSYCPRKISVFPQFPLPQFPLDSRILTKQLSCANTLQYPNHLPNCIFRMKRHQEMNMIYCYFHLLNFNIVLLTDFAHELFRSLPDLRFFKYLLTIFRTPYQVVCGVVDRMTRPFQCHASCYTILRKGLCGLGRLPVSLITLWARHAFIPVASHGALCKAFS